MYGGKFAIFALFYFVFEGKFQVQAPRGAGGLIFGGAYFRNFTVYRNSGKEKESRCLLIHVLHKT